MSEMMPYIWICIIVFASIAELHTLALVPVWFIPAGLAAFIMSLTGAVAIWAQVFIFFIISLVLFIISRTVFRRFIKVRKTGANFGYINSVGSVNFIIGKTAIVTEEINNYKNTGEIRINGFTWNAKSEDDDIIYESGLVVTVVEIEGARAVCLR